MKVIEVEANIAPRKVYIVDADEQHFLEFKEDIEVLPAIYYESDPGTKFFFRKRHEDGEPGWRGGGYECVEENGAKRAFHLDSLIVHPLYFKCKVKYIADRPGDVKHIKQDPKRAKNLLGWEAKVKLSKGIQDVL